MQRMLFSAFLLAAGCSSAAPPPAQPVSRAPSPQASARPTEAQLPGGISIRWLGHSSFLIATGQGLRVVTDPFGPGLGYPLVHPTADIVTVSHQHFDHKRVDQVRGSPEVVRGVGRRTARGVQFLGIAAAHETGEGPSGKGPDTIFVFEMEGIRFCHLGDLGRALTPQQVKEIGRVDVLIIPVGGYFTIGPKQAAQVVARLKPKVVIPIHYQTPVLGPEFANLVTVDDFLKTQARIRRLTTDTVTLSAGSLTKGTEVWVFPVPGAP